MTKRLAIIVAAGATVLGAMGLTAPTALAATTPAAVECGNHHVTTGTSRADYYGNCTNASVRIHAWLMYYPPLTIPTVTDQGQVCVPAQTDYLLGTVQTDTTYLYYATDGGDTTC